ncbi:hypothetical protein [uncultured Bacteroides sp.]|uniref:hypothetical protein n=1 Tax=uncultured Bacteroides sp. TaxID=162156 RepID=UPI00261F961C|nr:hypothetical protein [uncultured Bacteroides sp.]
MKVAKIIILFLLVCLLSACVKQSERYIKIVNKSERDIVFQSIEAKHFVDQLYPYICKGTVRTISKDSSNLYLCVDPSGWKADFKLYPCMTALFMDAEAYFRHTDESCDTIRKYVPILHVYRLTYEDLEQMNWTLVYPPAEEDSEPSSFSNKR